MKVVCAVGFVLFGVGLGLAALRLDFSPEKGSLYYLENTPFYTYLLFAAGLAIGIATGESKIVCIHGANHQKSSSVENKGGKIRF